jgi:hypothetical protein
VKARLVVLVELRCHCGKLAGTVSQTFVDGTPRPVTFNCQVPVDMGEWVSRGTPPQGDWEADHETRFERRERTGVRQFDGEYSFFAIEPDPEGHLDLLPDELMVVCERGRHRDLVVRRPEIVAALKLAEVERRKVTIGVRGESAQRM